MHKTLKLYTIDKRYIKYLSQYAPHLYREKDNKTRSRKYIGIVFAFNDFSYFVPLTSFKKKHVHLSDSVDFLKIERIAAININMMFPVPDGLFFMLDIKSEKNAFYRSLLVKESRYVKSMTDVIKRNAKLIYEESNQLSRKQTRKAKQ